MKANENELGQFTKVAKYLKENPDLKISGITAEQFEEKVLNLEKLFKNIKNLNLEIFQTEQTIETEFLQLHELEIRIGKAMLGFFGLNSKEAKDLGFKVTSERKKTVRRTKEEIAKEAIEKGEKAKAYLESLHEKK